MTGCVLTFRHMNTISISQLKVNPSKAINAALDYPLAVESRNKVEAYLLGRDLYEKITSYIEGLVDKNAVEETNFNKGKDFDKVVKELGL